MYDFKPGDEVVCVDAADRFHRCDLVKGEIYTVAAVRPAVSYPEITVVDLVEAVHNKGDGFFADRFRKVQRRNIEAWLETATDFEEPKRKKVGA